MSYVVNRFSFLGLDDLYFVDLLSVKFGVGYFNLFF